MPDVLFGRTIGVGEVIGVSISESFGKIGNEHVTITTKIVSGLGARIGYSRLGVFGRNAGMGGNSRDLTRLVVLPVAPQRVAQRTCC